MAATQKILEIGKEIADHRGNPLLILNLWPVNKVQALQIHTLLCDKNYKSLDVILQTGGGDIDAAFLITKILREHSQDVSVIVPLFAKSAGTLICLGASRI